jgi:hypothetical protein
MGCSLAVVGNRLVISGGWKEESCGYVLSMESWEIGLGIGLENIIVGKTIKDYSALSDPQYTTLRSRELTESYARLNGGDKTSLLPRI